MAYRYKPMVGSRSLVLELTRVPGAAFCVAQAIDVYQVIKMLRMQEELTSSRESSSRFLAERCYHLVALFHRHPGRALRAFYRISGTQYVYLCRIHNAFCRCYHWRYCFGLRVPDGSGLRYPGPLTVKQLQGNGSRYFRHYDHFHFNIRTTGPVRAVV